ncbi:MAG TPA: tripartite tricarboxylate transporter substrate binding protein, partial [Burkholderiales bacterium]|nr:tripartite tricarboxylate transporter substrate binding protein [Burkholderiales bacterium]
MGCSIRLAAAAIALIAASASAQDFPARSIRMIVPIGAGGSADTIARILARQMSERLGQQVVIDNRAGG